jgi:hypothetical protein
MGDDPSAHPVMAVTRLDRVIDKAIHAFLFKSRRRHESQPRLLVTSVADLKFLIFD